MINLSLNIPSISNILKYCTLFLIIFFGYNSTISAQQSIETIQSSRENTLKEIEYANKLLLETQDKSKKSLSEINIINHKLKKRNEYLMGVEMELSIINASISDNLVNIEDIEREVERIKDIYQKMIINLYKHRTFNYRFMYILASKNYNQLYKRLQIIKRYYKFLNEQKLKLDNIKKDIIVKNESLIALKRSKELLISEHSKVNSDIQNDLVQKKNLLSKLKNQQKEIELNIKEKERIAQKLENELKKVIEEQKREKGKVNIVNSLTPEEKLISSDFEKNIGRLPWPTQNGIITGKYGEHQHPDYKAVVIRNDGIYITAAKGEKVRAVFQGVISKVFSIPGENFTVIIKHGEYYTMYHNLIEVKVKAGQKVNTKDIIGIISTNERTNETELYFQIWRETEKKDPELWLAHE